MAAFSAAVNSSSSPVSGEQKLNLLDPESLPLIDLRLLSQLELLSLSLCSASSSSFHSLRSDTDLSTPKIDRSVFNESAGSRKQTFSRLRLAPRGSSQFASASASTANSLHRQISEVPLQEESRQIVSRLKSLFGVVDSPCGQNGGEDNLVSVPIRYDEDLSSPSPRAWVHPVVPVDTADSSCSGDNEQPAVLLAGSVGNKRKRGRPSKAQANVYGNCHKINDGEHKALLMPNCAAEDSRHGEKLGIVSVDAKAVELAALAKAGDPYRDRIRSSTSGMRTKEEVLDFLQGIQGQWTSSRRKRKMVDASAFGDLLPSGWKLLIRVTRRAGNIWLDCGSYISPNGQRFVSFTEVASYLLAASEPQDASLLKLCSVNGNVPVTSQNSAEAEAMCKDDKNIDEQLSTRFDSANPMKEKKDAASSQETASPGESQTQKGYKCHKCIMGFSHQDELLQHLLASHSGTQKKRKCGTEMNEEAVIKDGKYECQFCLKTFNERHRFHGHLGMHIKDYLKRMEASWVTGTIQKGEELPAVSVDSAL